MLITQAFAACLLMTAAHAGGLDDVQQLAHEVRIVDPQVATRVDHMQPVKNRAGSLYFPGADLMSPTAQLLIQDRILARKDNPEVRAALSYALNQEHRFSWAVIEQEEPLVRVAMLHGHKGLNAQDSTEVLKRALLDGDPAVRAEAVRLIGYRTEWRGLEQRLIAALQDDAPEVRRLTARSLGWLGIADGFTPLQLCLDDADPGVRAAAVRALGKIDAMSAKAMPKINQMRVQDQHPAVQRELSRVVQP